MVVSAANAIGESWTIYFALAVALEVGVLALIIGTAWTWPVRGAARTGQPGL